MIVYAMRVYDRGLCSAAERWRSVASDHTEASAASIPEPLVNYNALFGGAD